ncbi:phasin family protein [Paracoccus sp. 1_MG-2023]|uniref:phasin family protein n=1 Tax=unclassified Paracoccus (in: a-proteobacteria) TaxID=2688777 RepID=UPI001C09AB1F|nr:MULTISPECIES: phasin family protein [unclassified Paracoccus (in: a-proteobacteria)]MBU2959079.1 phasin family protein [Paracoccus sp. C2R09]MDO6669052.1 phasin family protein [Paracoccus sp. 1_MG-2023]
MAKTPDFTKTMQDMMANFPIDTSSMKDAMKTQTAMGEKFAKIALGAAERSTEISSAWAKDSIARMGELAVVKEEPSDYAKAMSDFASASAEMAAEHMASFAEVAKKVQMDTVDLMLTAGKDMAADAEQTAQRATRETTAAARKTAASAGAAAK